VALSAVLKEDGVPELLKDKHVILNSGLLGLWVVLDEEAKREIDRLVSLSFGWIFVDPLSLYHPKVQAAANRIAGCMGKNRWLNLFILDSVERIHDRSHLRSKLEADFASLYLPLVKPRFFGNLTSLGGVDVWHPDDFERVFRETVRLQGDARAPMQASQSPHRKLTTFGAGG
jgi:hypothetical protein